MFCPPKTEFHEKQNKAKLFPSAWTEGLVFFVFPPGGPPSGICCPILNQANRWSCLIQGAVSGCPPFEGRKLLPLWCELKWFYFVSLGKDVVTTLWQNLTVQCFTTGCLFYGRKNPTFFASCPGVHYSWAKYHQLLPLASRKRKQIGRRGRRNRGIEGTEVWGHRVLSESETGSSCSCTGVLGSSFQDCELLSLVLTACLRPS